MELKINHRDLLHPIDTGFQNQCGLDKGCSKIVKKILISGLEKHFKDEINIIVVRDFIQGMTIKFKGGKILEPGQHVFNNYMQDVKMMNVWN